MRFAFSKSWPSLKRRLHRSQDSCSGPRRLCLTSASTISKPSGACWPIAKRGWFSPAIPRNCPTRARPNYFNSSFLVSPEGQFEATYHKRRLVIFGEYIPFVRWLPFLKWLSPILGGFTPGDHPVQFKMTNPSVTTSVLICFEDMFPQEARVHVKLDTDFLINLTNDGWFGEGAEQWQQAAGAVFRAIENGVPLVRCANNGLTCWIDAQGRIMEIENEGGTIYGPDSLRPRFHCALLASGCKRFTTFMEIGLDGAAAH